MDAPAVFDLDHLEGSEFPDEVGTYRFTFLHQFEGEEASGKISEEGVVDRESNEAAYLQIHTGEAVLGRARSVRELRILDGVVTMVEGDTCTMTNSNLLDEALPATNFLPKPSRLLAGEVERLEAGVAINGRSTHHYVMDIRDFDRTIERYLDIVRLDRGEVYLDAEEGFLVRLEFEGFGKNKTISTEFPEDEGLTTYELNYFDFNQLVEIQPLEGCGPIPETSYPFMVENLFMYRIDSSGSFAEFTYLTPHQEVVAFYKSGLAEKGWTLSEETSFTEGDILLEFEDPNGGMLSVGIRDNSPLSAEEEGSYITSVDIIRTNLGP